MWSSSSSTLVPLATHEDLYRKSPDGTFDPNIALAQSLRLAVGRECVVSDLRTLVHPGDELLDRLFKLPPGGRCGRS